MRDWDDWASSAVTSSNPAEGDGAVPPVTILRRPANTSSSGGARLIAQIHDELLFEVDASDAVVGPDGRVSAPGAKLQHVASVVQGVMAMERLKLSVPLKVNLSWGQSWGSMQSLGCK